MTFLSTRGIVLKNSMLQTPYTGNEATIKTLSAQPGWYLKGGNC